MSTNWNEPQRQSAIGIFLFAAKAFRELIAILLVSFGSLIRKNKSTSTFVIASGIFAVIIFGRAILQYLYFRFYISDGQFIVKKGIFSKKDIVIPFERIQTVQLEQSLFHRIIGHYRVTIDTAGSDKAEAVIHSLTHSKALSLKEALTQTIVTDNVETVAAPAPEVIRLSASDLFKLALSHNHLETVGLIIAFVIARFNDIKEWFGIDAYDYIETQGKSVQFTTRIIASAAFLAIGVAIIISFLRIVLKFSDMQITLNATGFHLRYGLIHSKQQFIGANKIQFIQWNANWIRRKIGMYMFHVKATGDADIKNKQKIQVPVTRTTHLHMLAAYYQADLPSTKEMSYTIQKVYAFRRTLIIGIPVSIVVGVLAALAIEWYACLFALLPVYFYIRNRFYQRNFRFWVNDEAMEISSGVWGRQRIVVNWYKLQVATISQGIYQRHHQMADLILHTAAGDITIPYLTLQEAQQLSDYAAMKAESTSKRWM